MASQLLPPSLPLLGDPSLVLVADLEGRPGLAPAGHPHPLLPQPPPVLGEVGVVNVQQQDHPPLLTAVDHLDKKNYRTKLIFELEPCCDVKLGLYYWPYDFHLTNCFYHCRFIYILL